MNLSQIKQALNIRTLRAEKAERALTAARTIETQATNMLATTENQLRAFDASYEQRIAAFFDRTASGVTPESLHSSRTFHADLANERSGIEKLIQQAQHAVALASQKAAEARTVWVAASREADNLKDIYNKKRIEFLRAQERAAEQDADELSIARAFRDAG